MLHPQSFPYGTMTPGAPLPPHVGGVPEHPAVLIPEKVDIPLPRQPIEQVAVPASINGRDLSRGQP